MVTGYITTTRINLTRSIQGMSIKPTVTSAAGRFLPGDAIVFIKGDANGSGIVIGDGGFTMIGAGESTELLMPAEGQAAGQEKMIVASDTYIDFYVNCQGGLESAKKVTLNPNGQLTGHQKAITSGTAAPSGGENGDIYIQY